MQIAIFLGVSQATAITVLGSATVGSVLRLSAVPLKGDSPIRYSVQWLRDGAVISGATEATYTTRSADIGGEITARVTLPDNQVLTTNGGVTVIDPVVTPPVSSGELTLNDFSRDAVVYDSGASKGANVGQIPLSGTADPGAVVQARMVTETGAQVTAWTDVATTGGNGDWSGTATAARNDAWLRPEVRLKAATGTAATTINRCAVGHVVAFWGQSEWHRAVLSGFSNGNNREVVADEEALTVAFYDGTGSGWGSTGKLNYQTITNTDFVSSHMTALSNTLADFRPSEKFLFVFQTLSGTGLRSLMDDTTSARNWSDDLALHTFTFADGNHPGLALTSWYSADLPASGAQSHADRMFRTMTGLNPDGTPYVPAGNIDHIFPEIYDASRMNWQISGPHRFESNGYSTLVPEMRLALNSMFANPNLPATVTRGLEALTYRNGAADGSDASHPNTGGLADDGMHQLMRLTAADAMLGLGLVNWTVPEFDNATLDAGRAYVEVWSSAGDITTTRIERGEALGAGRPAVHGFRVNGVPQTDVTVVNGRVRVNWAVQDGDVLSFASDGIGTDTTPDDLTIHQIWKDYPVVDYGLPATKLAGVPVRGLTPQSVLGVIPQTGLPADPNTSPNLYAGQSLSTFSTTAPGWSDGTDTWIFNGDGTAQVNASSNRVATGLCPWGTVDVRGLETELSFVVQSPDAATGALQVTVTLQGGGGGTSVYSGNVDINSNINKMVTLDLGTIPNKNNRFEVKLMRLSAGASGILMLNRLTLKEKAGS